jgi:hypothetical protein
MLKLSEQWHLAHGGATAVDLLRQVLRPKLRNATARQMIAASLDLLIATWPRKKEPPLRVDSVSESIWRVSGLYYMYLPLNNDGALKRCMRLARSFVTTVIVPRRYEAFKQQMLEAVLGRRTPCVFSISSFISWRTFHASIDKHWTNERVVRELLMRYNQRVAEAKLAESLLVEIPLETF